MTPTESVYRYQRWPSRGRKRPWRDLHKERSRCDCYRAPRLVSGILRKGRTCCVPLLPTSSHHRVEYLHVPSAATKIASQPIANVCFARLRILLKQTNGSHHHAGRANTALCPAAFDASLLHRV